MSTRKSVQRATASHKMKIAKQAKNVAVKYAISTQRCAQPATASHLMKSVVMTLSAVVKYATGTQSSVLIVFANQGT